MLRRLLLGIGLVLAATLLIVGPASAQQYPEFPPSTPPPTTPPPTTPPTTPPPTTPPTTPPVVIDDEVTPPVVVEDDEVTPPQQEVAGDVVTRTLPVTGGDLVGLAAIGAGAVAVGAVLVSRRRQTT